jgi:hypothetical protein
MNLKNNCIKRLKAISNCSNSHNYTTNIHKLKFTELKYNQTIVLGYGYINTLQRFLAAHDTVAMAYCHDYFFLTLQAFTNFFSEFALGSSMYFFNV